MARAEREAYFYKTHGGAELDLLLTRKGKRYGFEFKYEASPRSAKSMHIVIEDLRLKRLWVIYPGETSYPLSEDIEVLPLADIQTALDQIG